MAKITLFKEVKSGAKKIRENSYFNGKKRIYYQCVTVATEKQAQHIKKGFHVGLPTGDAIKAAVKEETHTSEEANDNGEASNIEASS